MRLYAYFLLILLTTSCGDGSKVIVDHPLSNKTWSSGDLIQVNGTGDESAYLRIHHTDEYGYENLYIRITKDTTSQVLSIPLMDNQGLWLGKKSGASFVTDYRTEALDKVSSFVLEQYARDADLFGIERIQVVTRP